MLLVEGGVEVLWLWAGRIQTHPVHPLTSGASPPRHFVAATRKAYLILRGTSVWGSTSRACRSACRV
ncbi:hypothetical protein STRIP9103_09512 [Streptomyces ipomoeae 91-03]|uniref:Uncharacterized protein n=1 Tax=Streptomyces ipomoeae 91-03 TaxID=698759 RepID=L1L005_9ACTN|nr:hypothetical protein STRIP9103_09512 [Streptomyces ipomoeae 91-03]